ncbi:solute carrier family 2, facilitated glucose transporter member 1 isoform X2 [Tribolium castaneum]|uniref:Glucose transporter type 1-like Protein n=1 Tax=Tribolium castaneum TaxID=7070 RepID=A0A139WBX7_TRICA|nr:PREDICTED: solute carrier family 2, facilitated glucose transporter member 1 isoform X2 [Tribolium castaneum]KYB25426.1 Glucose transporter type 1-like Protein [Tribolium castaneum]|eukprot:XP_008198499.1 PREDICTED: solute carrier family 2, facilitated glucose transporter member 1 isoform X2 [Tribolium castaneum]
MPSNEKEISQTRPSWTRVLVLAGVATTIGSSLPVGYNIGVVNSPAGVIKLFCNQSVLNHYGVVLHEGGLDFLWSTIVAIFLVGGTIGSLGGSFFADKAGRKGALIVSSLIGTIAGVCFFASKAANSFEMLIVGRLLIGVSSGLITSVMPMYLTELAPGLLRGSMGVLCPLGVTCGVLLGQVLSLEGILGNEDYWPHLLAFYLLPLASCSVILVFLPESPKYLFIIKKQPHLALKQLALIRNTKEELLDHEIQELKLEEQDNDTEGEDWSIIRVLGDKSLLLPLLLVCSLQAGQQFSGINAVFYYSVSIFQKAGLSLLNSQLATIAAGCCNLLMAIISIPVMAKFNRRSTLQLSLVTTTFFLIILGLAITFISHFSWMPYLSIVGVLGFVICYGIALGPIPYFIGSELFEVGPRPSAMALGSMANWGGNFIVGLCFQAMLMFLGAASFFIFALVVVALFFFVRFYLPETRGRDPVQIAALCKRGFSSRPLDSPVNSASTVDTFSVTEKEVV